MTDLPKPDADGWIKHDGGPCPIPDAKAGEWEYRYGGNRLVSAANAAASYNPRWWQEITHYRIIKPESDYKSLLEQAVARIKKLEAELRTSLLVTATTRNVYQEAKNDAEAREEKVRALLEQAVDALRIYAADESWRLNGVCDPNSGNFQGQSAAHAALDAYEKAVK